MNKRTNEPTSGRGVETTIIVAAPCFRHMAFSLAVQFFPFSLHADVHVQRSVIILNHVNLSTIFDNSCIQNGCWWSADSICLLILRCFFFYLSSGAIIDENASIVLNICSRSALLLRHSLHLNGIMSSMSYLFACLLYNSLHSSAKVCLKPCKCQVFG